MMERRDGVEAEVAPIRSGIVVEDTGISTKTEESAELATAAQEAGAIAEIQAAMAVAQRYNRNENEAFQKVVRSLQRPSFAEVAEYVYTRGGTVVKGPSIYLATEFARAWGNMRVGLDVVRADGHTTTIRGWAWDLETNAFWAEQDHFRNVVKRKGGYRQADERELREEKNRRGSICMRNAVLKLLPKDLVEEACSLARVQKTKDAAADPDATKRGILKGFAALTPPVKAEQLEVYMGHGLDECTPEDLVDLRAIYTSIKEGYTNWREDYAAEVEPDESTKVDESPLKTSAKKTKAKRKPKPKPKEEKVEEPPPEKPPTVSEASQGRIMAMANGKPSGLLMRILKSYGVTNLPDLPANLEMAVISDLAKKG